MVSEIPFVRYFVLCQEVIVDPIRRSYTLRDLIHSVLRLPGEPFPCICPEMALFALLANGRGEHEVGIELAILDNAVERVLRRPAPRRIDLGQDPTAVHGLPIPLRNVAFERAGQYVFGLLCDGHRIAEAFIDVR